MFRCIPSLYHIIYAFQNNYLLVFGCIPSRINPCNALYGGRTNASKLYDKTEPGDACQDVLTKPCVVESNN